MHVVRSPALKGNVTNQKLR